MDIREPKVPPTEERIRALLCAPRNAEGYFTVSTHLHTRRSSPPTYLSWIDVGDNHPAAGRYLIHVDHHDAKIKAATPEATAAALARRAQLQQY